MHATFYYTYIVASRSRTLFIGVTGDLTRRVLQHKRKTYVGFSSAYNCNRLIWFERYVHPIHAILRAKQLQGWSRTKKMALIEKKNSTWNDLSVGWFTPVQLQLNAR